jgi:hypothetical protein
MMLLSRAGGKMPDARSMALMIIPTGNLEKRLTQLKKEVPSRGIERHPSVLQNISDLPVELRSPALTALASTGTIHTIIAFPPQIQRGWHYVPKQALLFTPTGLACVKASIWPDHAPEVASVDAGGLLYVRASLLLLYGFLEIVAQDPVSPLRIGMEFNTVAWERIFRPLRQLLASRAGTAATASKITPSPPVQAALAGLPLKYSNGVKIFVSLPGEELEELVFQPGLWSGRKSWPFFFRKPITADTLLCLTTNFLIAIQEEPKVRRGWIVTYIPRSSCLEIHNRAHGAWSELAVRLEQSSQAAEVSLPLRSAAVETWRGVWLRHGGRWQDLLHETSEVPPDGSE